MLAYIFKGSGVVSVVVRVVHALTNSYRNSLLRKIIKSYKFSFIFTLLHSTKEYYIKSYAYKALMCFVNPYTDWNESVFYRIIAFIVTKPIIVIKRLYGKNLESSTANSICVRIWDNSKENIKQLLGYYIFLFIFVIANVLLILMYAYRYSVNQIILGILVWLLSLIFTLILKKVSIYSILQNSLIIRWGRKIFMGYWENDDGE